MKIVNKTLKPPLTPGRAALLALTGRYLAGLMDYSISLLEIHKLLYFLQETGEPLKLKYVKGPFGPYAENLRYVLNLLEGHYLQGFSDGEDAPGKEIELINGAAKEGETFLAKSTDSRQRFQQVCDLIAGYETAFGMELLATVHWVKTKEGAATISEAISKTYSWNKRKHIFTEKHIAIAWKALENWSASPDKAPICS